MYWPDAGSETYGDLVVSLLREDILASYTLRTFTIRPMRPPGGKKSNLVSAQAAQASAERTVYQYHFTAWPDHGVPSDPGCVLNFLHDVNAMQENLKLQHQIDSAKTAPGNHYKIIELTTKASC